MKKIFQNILLGLAIIGVFILTISLGGRRYYRSVPRRSHTVDINDYEFFWIFGLGVCLTLPLLIHQFSKSSSKKVLIGKKLDLAKMGHTLDSYFQFKTKKGFVEIYVQNQTGDTLIVNRKSLLENGRWYVFKVKKHRSLYFSNGIIFNLTEESHAELIDSRNQVSSLGDEYIKEHGIPDYVNHAFILGGPNEGDG